MDDDLARAAVLWTGRGTRPWPQRDDDAVIREFGAAGALPLLATLRRLDADFRASEAHRTEPDLPAMTRRAADEFRSRHPDAAPELVDALAWSYSFDWR